MICGGSSIVHDSAKRAPKASKGYSDLMRLAWMPALQPSFLIPVNQVAQKSLLICLPVATLCKRPSKWHRNPRPSVFLHHSSGKLKLDAYFATRFPKFVSIALAPAVLDTAVHTCSLSVCSVYRDRVSSARLLHKLQVATTAVLDRLYYSLLEKNNKARATSSEGRTDPVMFLTVQQQVESRHERQTKTDGESRPPHLEGQPKLEPQNKELRNQSKSSSM